MHASKSYKELVFYLEACESGSMFDKILKSELNIYTTTAANPNQSSWATYCSPQDIVNGKHIGSCLGDEYSCNWMEDSDQDKGLKSTLQTQYDHVKATTKNSEVHQYGQLKYTSNDIGQYQGNHIKESEPKGIVEKIKRFVKKVIRKIKEFFGLKLKKKQTIYSEEFKLYLKKAKESRVDSRDAKLQYFYNRAHQNHDDTFAVSEYLQELSKTQKIDSVFATFNEQIGIKSDLNVTNINFDCLKPSVEAYKIICGWDEYSLKYVKNIALACERNLTVDEIRILFEKICKI